MYRHLSLSRHRVRALGAIGAVIVLASFALADSPKITVTSYGAAEKVSGSLHVLDIGDTRAVIDSGLEYAEKQDDTYAESSQQARKRAVYPLDAADIDAVFLTHAHLDHVGRIPLLVASGYSGPIYCTKATKELLPVVMESQLHFDREVVRDWYWSAISREKALENKKTFTVHWMPDCPFGNRIHAKNRRAFEGSQRELLDFIHEADKKERFSGCRECEQRNVDAIMRLIKTIKVGEPRELAPGVTFEFLPTGHLPGSVAVLVEAKHESDRCRLLFSGDLGNGLSPLRAAPPAAPPSDFVAIETTYGARVRPPETKREFERFRTVLGDAIKKGHTVLIPAFSLDRTQAVLHQLHIAREEGRLPADTPVYCPSPTARRYTEIYERNRPLGWFPEAVTKADGAWSPDAVLSRPPNATTLASTPLIYLATNSLGYAAWSRQLLEDLLPRDDVHLLFIGYQGEGTLGRQIEQGAKKVSIGKKSVPVNATIDSFECFSGHGDSADIDAWLANIPQDVTVMLIHGDEDALRDRAAQLKAGGRQNVVIAQRGKPVPVAWPKVKSVHP